MLNKDEEPREGLGVRCQCSENVNPFSVLCLTNFMDKFTSDLQSSKSWCISCLKLIFFHLKRKTNISRKSHGLLVLAYHYKRSKTKEGEMSEQHFLVNFWQVRTKSV